MRGGGRNTDCNGDNSPCRPSEGLTRGNSKGQKWKEDPSLHGTEKEPGWLKTLHTEQLKLFLPSPIQPSTVTGRLSLWKIQWVGFWTQTPVSVGKCTRQIQMYVLNHRALPLCPPHFYSPNASRSEVKILPQRGKIFIHWLILD